MEAEEKLKANIPKKDFDEICRRTEVEERMLGELSSCC